MSYVEADTINPDLTGGRLREEKQRSRMMDNVYSGAENTGRAMRIGAAGAQMAGRGIKTTGKGLRKGGQAMMRAGASMSGSGLGAIAGLPLMAAGGLATAAGAGTEIAGEGMDKAGKVSSKVGKTFQGAGTAGQLRSMKNADKMAMDVAKKAMPAPLALGVKAAEFAGVDVMKVFRIVVIVNITLQILFWIIIILAAGYAFTHAGELLWTWFKSIFPSITPETVPAPGNVSK